MKSYCRKLTQAALSRSEQTRQHLPTLRTQYQDRLPLRRGQARSYIGTSGRHLRKPRPDLFFRQFIGNEYDYALTRLAFGPFGVPVETVQLEHALEH